MSTLTTVTVRTEIDYGEAITAACFLGHRREGKDISQRDLFELSACIEAMRRKYEDAHKENLP